jgi:hypothetical protein
VIRRQSDILIAKLVLSTLVVAIVSLLLVGMVHRVVGTVFGIVGIGLTQRWFDSVRSSMRTTR